MQSQAGRPLIMDSLPPGFRFYPTAEELVSFYLHKKLESPTDDEVNRLMDGVIPILDIYDFNPSDLPHYAGDFTRRDPEQWFFFIPRQESEARGGRPKRLTNSGYWKATGSPGYVYSSDLRIIGVKRTMVFYEGRAPSGTKTEWKMNEYKAIQGEAPPSTTPICALSPEKLRQEFSLCRVYKKSKSPSAFDRRPLAVNRRAATIQAHDGGVVDDQAIQMEERATSLDGSPSGDHHHHHHHRDQYQTQSQTVEAHAPGSSSTTGMHAVDDEPVVDWENFDWGYDLQQIKMSDI